MNPCMIGRDPTGLSVGLETRPSWVEESMPNSNLDPSAAEFNCFERTESSDSKIDCIVDQKLKLRGLPIGGTSNLHNDEFWHGGKGLSVCLLRNIGDSTVLQDQYMFLIHIDQPRVT